MTPSLLAIDPGSSESAWLVYDAEEEELRGFAKILTRSSWSASARVPAPFRSW